jgi:hypothetical protein
VQDLHLQDKYPNTQRVCCIISWPREANHYVQKYTNIQIILYDTRRWFLQFSNNTKYEQYIQNPDCYTHNRISVANESLNENIPIKEKASS